jgi:hypothetical protein
MAQPKKDAADCKDHPLLDRVASYWIESCVQKPSNSYKFDTGKTYNDVQGRYWYIRYQPPAGQAAKPSAEVLHHFEAIIKNAGGGVVHADSGKETLKLDKDGKEYWIEAWTDHLGKYILTIVERAAPSAPGVTSATVPASTTPASSSPGQKAPPGALAGARTNPLVPKTITTAPLTLVGTKRDPVAISTAALTLVGIRAQPVSISTAALTLVGTRASPVTIATPQLTLVGRGGERAPATKARSF